MTNTLSVKSKRSALVSFKYLNWFIPIVLLSVLSIVSFYDEYKFNTFIYISKHAMIILFIFSLILFLSKRKIDWGKMIIVMSFLTVISSLSIYNMPFTTQNLYFEAVTNVAMYILVAALAVFIFPKIKFEEFKVMLSVMFAVILIFVTVPSLINVQDMQYYTDIDNRFRYTGIFDNPNELSRFAMLGSLLAVRLWFLYKETIKKLMFIFMFFANTYLIYLSDSRTSMISIVILLSALFVIWLYKSMPKYLFFGLASISLSALTFILFYYVNVVGINPIDNLNDLTSGRIAIWSSILNTDLIGYLFGTGPMINLGSHNGYLEILKFFGVFGLIFWIIIFGYLLVKKIKITFKNTNNSKIVGLSIVILFFVYHLFEGSMVSIANIASIYFWLELSQRNE